MDRDWNLPERQVTPESVFWSRREVLLRGGGALAAAATLGLPGPGGDARAEVERPYPAQRNAALSVDLPLTDEKLAATYNNFYEFGTDKTISGSAQSLVIDPWAVEIGGLVERPATLAFEDLERRFSLEERVYRFRCVEAWAMVVPWTGLPLAALLEWAGVKPEARYVRFETFHRPRQALGQLLTFWYPWPYTEGLTLAEARNPLAMLVTGVYGKPLPKQHGAPLRLIVPWKYGFKSIKSLVRIDLVHERPKTFWNTAAADEYGFFANVNPDVPHPRWSQATERLLGSDERQATLLYNGYGKWVAELYRDLREP
jgi:sulfoxide reductase catalytic subunit YedY